MQSYRDYELLDASRFGKFGSIITFFGFLIVAFLQGLGQVALIIGLILKAVAVNKISNALNNKEIFRNYLTSIIVEVVGDVLALIALFVTVLMSKNAFVGYSLERDFLYIVFRLMFPIFVFLEVARLISVAFLYKSYGPIESELNIPEFKDAAKLYLISALTSITIVGGIIFGMVASIREVDAYSNISKTTSSKEQQKQVQAT